eukprot:TRINITY_DN7989_c0_g1_i3.p1 TRINITY_DN7989_c0_g1~~TRINITY_DN7989_c0_g1_i3.p1  ORF type:complete len:269 (-),score=20.15 TRINITY_DN7989_c0_g1_i3:214-1020(-)
MQSPSRPGPSDNDAARQPGLPFSGSSSSLSRGLARPSSGSASVTALPQSDVTMLASPRPAGALPAISPRPAAAQTSAAHVVAGSPRSPASATSSSDQAEIGAAVSPLPPPPFSRATSYGARLLTYPIISPRPQSHQSVPAAPPASAATLGPSASPTLMASSPLSSSASPAVSWSADLLPPAPPPPPPPPPPVPPPPPLPPPPQTSSSSAVRLDTGVLSDNALDACDFVFKGRDADVTAQLLVGLMGTTEPDKCLALLTKMMVLYQVGM